MSAPSAPVSPSSAPLAGERVAFTGTLASMTHRRAQELAEKLGGIATHHVSRMTTILVIGEEGWPLEADGTPSIKLQQVQRWREEGLPIRILGESDWLTCLGQHDHLQEVRRHYTPAMLSRMLDVPVNVIRQWEKCGLIRPVRHVYRLPYFDFCEVAGARKLAELLRVGVSQKQIAESLEHLQRWIGGAERPLAQLEILAGNGQLICRTDSGPIDPLSGQRLFDFHDEDEQPDAPVAVAFVSPDAADRSRWRAEDWLQEAENLSQQDLLAEAIHAYRQCLLLKTGQAEVHFHLADALFRHENLAGALERYHMAVELDPHYLEAWTQLGCVYASLDQPAAAIEALQNALNLHPDYSEAHWHLAQLHTRNGNTTDARPHWVAYLEHDSRGPWADLARQQLDEIDQSQS